MRCMHHVVARFVGKGDLRDVDTAGRTRGRGRPLRVRHAHERQLRLRDDHAERDVHVHDVHHPAAQAALSSTRELVDFALHVQRLLDGQALVHEGQLHVLAGAEVRSAEHHRVAAVHERPQAAVQLVGVSRHLHALDRQLVVDLPAHAHDGHVRGPLAVAEAHIRWLDIQTRRTDARALRSSDDVVIGVHHIVEERARLDERGKRSRTHVVPERRGSIVQIRKERVRSLKAQAAFELLQHVT